MNIESSDTGSSGYPQTPAEEPCYREADWRPASASEEEQLDFEKNKGDRGSPCK